MVFPERAGPGTLRQRPSVDQELDLLRTQEQKSSYQLLAPNLLLCFGLGGGILKDFALDSEKLFS